jgi:hypothetical protein
MNHGPEIKPSDKGQIVDMTHLCLICGDIYNDDNPKCDFSCGHKCCSACRTNITYADSNTTTATFTCPYCRTVSEIDIPTLMDDFSEPNKILNMSKKLYTNKQTIILCDNCGSNANHSCFSCEINLCDKCWPIIHKLGKLLQHQQETLIEKPKKFTCPLHSKYDLELFCHTCANNENSLHTFVCIMCEKSAKHAGHQVELVTELVPRYKTDLSERLDKVNDKMLKACQTVVHLKQFADDHVINSYLEKTINKIKSHFDDYRQKIDEYERDAVDHVIFMIRTQALDIEKQRTELKKYILEGSEITSQVDQELRTSNEYILATNFESQYDRLYELAERHVDWKQSEIVEPALEKRFVGPLCTLEPYYK